VLAITAYGIGPALLTNSVAMQKPDLGIMEEKSLPPTGSSLDENLTELRTLLPNQMINQPDTEKKTDEEYWLKTNTGPIQIPVLETVEKPDWIITNPTQQPEEQLETLYESEIRIDSKR
jgi:hypothetical protein